MRSKVLGVVAFTMAMIGGGLGYGCGSSNTPAAATVSAASGLGTAQSNLTKYTPSTNDLTPTAFNSHQMMHGLAELLFPSAMATSYTPFGAQWAGNFMPGLYCSTCGNNYSSLKNYMGQMIDPAFLNQNGSATGAAGRYVNGIFQTCLTMAVLNSACGTDTDGLPPVGTCSASLSLSSVTGDGTFYQGCLVPKGFTASQAQNGGGGGSTTLTVTVTAVTGNPNYTKKIVVGGAPGGNGSITSTAYAKLNPATGAFNFENISPGDNQTNNASCGGSRYILSLNGNVTQFEYQSITLGTDVAAGCASGNSHQDWYRIHLDTGLDTAYILGMQHNNGSVNGLTFLLSGQPSKIAADTGNVSVSVWAADGTAIPAGSGGSLAVASADACVTQSTGTISTDGQLACDISGLDVISAASMLSTANSTNLSTNVPTSNSGTPAAIAWTSATDFATGVTSP